MAIVRPTSAAATPAATAAPAKPAAGAKPAATKPAPKAAPAAQADPAATLDAAEPEGLVDSADPALDNLELHDTTMDVPEDTAPPRQPLAETPAQAGKGVATRPRDDDDDGFGALDDEVGFGSFEILKLDKMEFVCGEHTFEGRAGVDVIIRGMKKKYLHKARQNRSDDDDVPLAYSYDGVYGTDGRALEEHYKEWRDAGEMEAGAKPVISRYIEAGAEIVMSGHALDGEMVLLNIAPASVSRLAGYREKLKIKGLKMDGVVTKLTLGKKLNPKGGSKTFYPWDFKMVAEVE